jgi:hypothetical protein
MGQAVFTTDATIQCPHGSKVPAGGFASASKLTVNGKPAMTVSDFANTALDGTCSQKPPPSGLLPCTMVVSVSGTISARLTVGSTAVVTGSLAGMTDGKPLFDLGAPPASSDAGQALLTAD